MANSNISGPLNVPGGVVAPLQATNLTTTGVVTINGANMNITGLPTTNPNIAGRLWSNSGVLTVSAG